MIKVMNIYLGTFLIAFASLAFEVTLSRLLSVVTWYHLAFFAISTAMLGMTAGATTVYLKPGWFTKEKLNDSLAKSCIAFALVIPFVIKILCLLRLDANISIKSIFVLFVATIACSVPFYFSGIAITVILTKYKLPIGKLYASDLVGAALGCLFVLGGLEILDAPSLLLLCGSIGALAGVSFAWHNSITKLRNINGGIFFILIILALINPYTSFGIRPSFYKGQAILASDTVLEKWNSFSHITVLKKAQHTSKYATWGGSPKMPKKKVSGHIMMIDGGAGTLLERFNSPEDISHLRFDVTNVVHYLRPKGDVCIIGVGGGRDIHSALLFGHENVTGIEINPIFIDLLQGDFKEFAGIANRKEVKLVVDEARSFLSKTKEKYSIVQMSLIDTFAATAAGAFTLSENCLYTLEAWQVFLNRLNDDGIFTVSRWHSTKNLGETGRIVSLAVASLLQYGIKNPSQHIAMVTTDRISTLLLSRQPFSQQEITKLKTVCSELQFTLAIQPGSPPSNKILKKIIFADSLKKLNSAIADEPLNFEPTTDEHPYFFNMLRLGNLAPLWAARINKGVVYGNLVATLYLAGLILSLLLLAIATIIFPLIVKSRSERTAEKRSKILWSGALYFSLIGAGFMFVEIALIQRLSVFLGHPVYALGVLLFTIILSAGIGSFLSEYLPQRSPWIFAYPIIMVLAILVMQFVLPVVTSTMITFAILKKVIIAVLVVSPLGVIMGIFFPTGIRMVESVSAAETPWFWALNGIFRCALFSTCCFLFDQFWYFH